MVSASRIAAESLRVVPRKRLSRMMGRLADLKAPPAVVSRMVEAFVRAYRVDLSEAEVPDAGFQTFDAFFTRRLKPGARPIEGDAKMLVSPADGRLVCAQRLSANQRFVVKGRSYDLAELLDDDEDAARYAKDGFLLVVYLAPPDYHRVHAALAGPVRRARRVAGTLFPVNAIGEHVPELFGRNERVILHQAAGALGSDFLTILVGAMGVGRVGLAFDELTTNEPRSTSETRHYDPPVEMEKGAELGMFHLGSTVILVGTAEKVQFLRSVGEKLRVGQPLLRVEQ